MKSIGTRLALQISGAIILVMVVFGAVNIAQRHHRNVTLLNGRQKRITEQLSLMMGSLLFDMYHQQIQQVMYSFLPDPDILSVKVIEEGEVIAFFGKFSETGDIVNLSEKEAPPHYEHAEMRTHDIRYNEEHLGTLEVTFSRAAILRETYEAVISLSWNLLIVIIIEALLVVLLVKRNITQPLLALVQAARKIAEGDVNIVLERRSSSDEIGRLTNAFKTMVQYISAMTNVATGISNGDLRQHVMPRSPNDVLGHAFLNMAAYLNDMAAWAIAIAEGDLTHDIQSKTEHDVLGNAFREKVHFLRQSISAIIRSTTQLRDASEALNRISEQMVLSTEESSRQTSTVALNSRQITENVNAVAVAMEQLSAGVREMSNSTNQVAQIAGVAVEQASSANTTIADLAARSQEISDIINAITNVSQQTNLLALNATIEAARAGEFGKGFAVVAHEIKELSRETATSAEDIIRKLEAIRSGSTNATERITAVLNSNMHIRDISIATAGGVEEHTMTTREIADKIGQAAHDSRDISDVINTVDEAVRENTTRATSVQRAAQDLAALADELQHLVSKFKISS